MEKKPPDRLTPTFPLFPGQCRLRVWLTIPYYIYLLPIIYRFLCTGSMLKYFSDKTAAYNRCSGWVCPHAVSDSNSDLLLYTHLATASNYFRGRFCYYTPFIMLLYLRVYIKIMSLRSFRLKYYLLSNKSSVNYSSNWLIIIVFYLRKYIFYCLIHTMVYNIPKH